MMMGMYENGSGIGVNRSGGGGDYAGFVSSG
jgi:hypothetical protein